MILKIFYYGCFMLLFNLIKLKMELLTFDYVDTYQTLCDNYDAFQEPILSFDNLQPKGK